MTTWLYAAGAGLLLLALSRRGAEYHPDTLPASGIVKLPAGCGLYSYNTDTDTYQLIGAIDEPLIVTLTPDPRRPEFSTFTLSGKPPKVRR